MFCYLARQSGYIHDYGLGAIAPLASSVRDLFLARRLGRSVGLGSSFGRSLVFVSFFGAGVRSSLECLHIRLFGYMRTYMGVSVYTWYWHELCWVGLC